MTDFSPESLASIGPKEFAQLVKSTPDSKITEVMAGDARTQDPRRGLQPDAHAVPRRTGPATPRPSSTGSSPAAPDGATDTYETVIENGACTVTNQPVREPKLAMTMDPVTFLKVVSGDGNPMMMFMTGKIKAKGDLGLAANIAKLFDIPKALTRS